jgi:hypothetical protein
MSPRKCQPAALRYAHALLALTAPARIATRPAAEKSMAQMLAEEPEWQTLTEAEQRTIIGDAEFERRREEAELEAAYAGETDHG